MDSHRYLHIILQNQVVVLYVWACLCWCWEKVVQNEGTFAQVQLLMNNVGFFFCFF